MGGTRRHRGDRGAVLARAGATGPHAADALASTPRTLRLRARMPTRYWLVVGTFLLSMLLYVDRACISAAKGAISRDLALSDTQFGWVLAAFALGYALTQTPAGALADRLRAPPRARRRRDLLVAVHGPHGRRVGLRLPARRALPVWRRRGRRLPRVRPRVLRMAARCRNAGSPKASTSRGPAGRRVRVAGRRRADRTLGWRTTFVVLAVIGFVWAAGWYVWFADDPVTHPRLSADERALHPRHAATAAVAGRGVP